MTKSNETSKFRSDQPENLPSDLVIPNTITKLSEFRDVENDIFFSMFGEHEVDDTRSALWSYRQNIEDLLRPRGFNGTIDDIKISRMPNPFEQLVTCNERGLSFVGTPASHARLKNDAFIKSRHEGIVLTAHATSPNSGIDMPLYYEIWYSKLPRTRSSHLTSVNYGGISRYIARDLEQDLKVEQFPRKRDIGRIGVSGALGSSMPISRSYKN